MSRWKRRRLRSIEHTYYHVNPFEYEDALIGLIDMASKAKYAEHSGDAFLVYTPSLPTALPDPNAAEVFKEKTAYIREREYMRLRKNVQTAQRELKCFIEKLNEEK